MEREPFDKYIHTLSLQTYTSKHAYYRFAFHSGEFMSQTVDYIRICKIHDQTYVYLAHSFPNDELMPSRSGQTYM